MSDRQPKTMGHVWDETLEEYDNPLPRWWLWTFYGTIVFAVVYWIMYPVFPIGDSFTRGTATLEYTPFENGKPVLDENGEPVKVETPWNTRYLLLTEMNNLDPNSPAGKQRAMMEQVSAASYNEIINDATMMDFVNSVAKGTFGDNCAACHQQGGAGIVGLYPNLADDDWLYGGSFAQIEHTLREGRVGYMPPFNETLSDAQVEDVANYVLSLSGGDADAEKAARGSKIFNGEVGGCYYCHDKGGVGRTSQGAPNLTDSIWTIAKIYGDTTAEEKIAQISKVVNGGAGRVMPAWDGRLSDTEIKILTAYVHQLGGGQ